MVFDSLWRPFLGIEDLGGGTTYTTKVVLDIRGLPSQIIDARGNVAEGRTHGILGQVLETTSADAGDRQALTTILGEPLRGWDAKDQCARVTYDALRRPVDGYVQPAVGSEILLSRVITKLGDLPTITPRTIEKLYTADLAYLQDLYRSINQEEANVVQVTCPACGHNFEGEITSVGG